MRTIRAQPLEQILQREIYVLAGESDMSGRGLLGDLPAFANADRIKVFSNAWVWVDGAEPVDSPVGQIDTVSLDTIAAASPGMAFADALADVRPAREIALVPCAVGGSKMAHWARDLSRSTLYGSMIARAKEAAKTGVLKGIIWWQGKNDTGSGDAASSAAWATNCQQLIADIRSDLDIPSLPVVLVVIDSMPGAADIPYVATVQSQQRSIIGTGIAQVETDDLPHKSGDPVHLSTAGLVTAGQRCATAMNGLLS